MTEQLHFHFLLLTKNNPKRIFVFMTNGKNKDGLHCFYFAIVLHFVFVFSGSHHRGSGYTRMVSPRSFLGYYAQHLSIKPS